MLKVNDVVFSFFVTLKHKLLTALEILSSLQRVCTAGRLRWRLSKRPGVALPPENDQVVRLFCFTVTGTVGATILLERAR